MDLYPLRCTESGENDEWERTYLVMNDKLQKKLFIEEYDDVNRFRHARQRIVIAY